MTAAAVFFDVDFTLIYPGPTFEGDGYAAFGRKHGLVLDAGRFAAAVAAASALLEDDSQERYDHELYVRYTRAIIEGMGGEGGGVDACARDVYAEWASSHHFHLYDDVKPALRELDGAGYRIGLISNSHRCLASFQQHFDLHGMIAAAVSSSAHGYLKPHPSIFEAALTLAGVRAEQAVMVGDSLRHDIEGARRVGMRGVLVRRSGSGGVEPPPGVPVISDLAGLRALL
ncbi:MAG: HAD family hydrolase [Acidimicrobiia bacterium]|nr:HAD family hydrolase [Acidimicrobiia bacterium]